MVQDLSSKKLDGERGIKGEGEKEFLSSIKDTQRP
jgi:hypothetical protein